MSSFWTAYAEQQGIRLTQTKSGHTVATSTKTGKLLASGASEAAVVGEAAKKIAIGQNASRIARSQMQKR
jgi:hypothetical protein